MRARHVALLVEYLLSMHKGLVSTSPTGHGARHCNVHHSRGRDRRRGVSMSIPPNKSEDCYPDSPVNLSKLYFLSDRVSSLKWYLKI